MKKHSNFCINCGQQLVPNSIFCHSCGLKVDNLDLVANQPSIEVDMGGTYADEKHEEEIEPSSYVPTEAKNSNRGLIVASVVLVFTILIAANGSFNNSSDINTKPNSKESQEANHLDWNDYLQKLRNCEISKEIGAACTSADGTIIDQSVESLSVDVNPSYSDIVGVVNSDNCSTRVNINAIISFCAGEMGTDDYWLGRATVLEDISSGRFTTLTYKSAKNSRVICRTVLEEFIETYGTNRSNKEFADFFLGCRYMVVERLAPYGTNFEQG